MRNLGLVALAGALLGASAASADPYPLPTGPSSGAPANPAPGAHAHHAGPMRQALEGVGLSADQKSKIKAAFAQYRTAKNSATPMSRRQLMSNIAGVLTPDQQSQFKTLLGRYRKAQKNAATQNGSPGTQPAPEQPAPQPHATT